MEQKENEMEHREKAYLFYLINFAVLKNLKT